MQLLPDFQHMLGILSSREAGVVEGAVHLSTDGTSIHNQLELHKLTASSARPVVSNSMLAKS